MSINDIKAALRARRKKNKPSFDGFLSTGSTLLNLACSGSPFGGFPKGGYILVVGDSTSGKTVLAGTCLAEVCLSKRFDDYVLVFDNVEDGARMFEKFFGERVLKRVKPPGIDEKGVPVYSRTAQEFYYNIHRALKKHGKVIYVLDSENALSSDEEHDKFEEQMTAHERGTFAAGSYGDAKAKIHSQNLRSVYAALRDSGSILIVTSQTRDNIGFGFEKKTRSGGRALRFYATLELWSSVKQKIRKTVKGKSRTVGVLSEVQIKKNRITGKDRTVTVPIYHSFGFDDVGACIDYLLEEKHWSKRKGGIDAADFGFRGSREALISHIEDNGLERKLAVLVGKVWNDIEAALEVRRKNRYK